MSSIGCKEQKPIQKTKQKTKGTRNCWKDTSNGMEAWGKIMEQEVQSTCVQNHFQMCLTLTSSAVEYVFFLTPISQSPKTFQFP